MIRPVISQWINYSRKKKISAKCIGIIFLFIIFESNSVGKHSRRWQSYCNHRLKQKDLKIEIPPSLFPVSWNVNPVGDLTDTEDILLNE